MILAEHNYTDLFKINKVLIYNDYPILTLETHTELNMQYLNMCLENENTSLLFTSNEIDLFLTGEKSLFEICNNTSYPIYMCEQMYNYEKIQKQIFLFLKTNNWNMLPFSSEDRYIKFELPKEIESEYEFEEKYYLHIIQHVSTQYPYYAELFTDILKTIADWHDISFTQINLHIFSNSECAKKVCKSYTWDTLPDTYKQQIPHFKMT